MYIAKEYKRLGAVLAEWRLRRSDDIDKPERN